MHNIDFKHATALIRVATRTPLACQHALRPQPFGNAEKFYTVTLILHPLAICLPHACHFPADIHFIFNFLEKTQEMTYRRHDFEVATF